MRSRATLLALVVVGTSALVAAPAPGAGPCDSPTIRGPDGDDVLCGGAGQDRLVGGTGADELYGGTDAKVAEDTDYYLYYGDTLSGGPGADTLDGGLDPRHEGSVDRVT